MSDPASSGAPGPGPVPVPITREQLRRVAAFLKGDQRGMSGHTSLARAADLSQVQIWAEAERVEWQTWQNTLIAADGRRWRDQWPDVRGFGPSDPGAPAEGRGHPGDGIICSRTRWRACGSRSSWRVRRWCTCHRTVRTSIRSSRFSKLSGCCAARRNGPWRGCGHCWAGCSTTTSRRMPPRPDWGYNATQE